MPMYCWKCANCGRSRDIMRLMARRNDFVICTCGLTMSRDIGAEQGKKDDRAFDKPIEMYSVGMNSWEVPAFRRANPGVEVHGGVPLARTRADKIRTLRYFGFSERN